MTDPWARPSGSNEPNERGPDETIEIELVGPDSPGGRSPDGEGPDRPATNWRRLAGSSALAGVLIGIIVAVVIVSSGGDDAATPTTLDRDAVAGEITAPPTITLEAPPTVPGPSTAPSTAPGSPTTSAGAGSSPSELTPIDSPLDLADGDFALAPVDDDLPVAAQVSISATSDRQPVPVALVQYEPITHRARMVQDMYRAPTQIDIDLTGGIAYLQGDAGTWQTVDAADLFIGFTMTLDELFETITRGPVRESTLAGAVTVGTSPDFFQLDDGTRVRRYSVSIPADALPEAESLYGPALDGDDAVLDFVVYVSRTGQPVLTEGVRDGPEGTVWLRNRRASSPYPIEFPDPADVVGDPSPAPTSAADMRPDYERTGSPPDAAAVDAARRRLTAALATSASGVPMTVVTLEMPSDHARPMVARRDGGGRRSLEAISSESTYVVQIDDADGSHYLPDPAGGWTRFESGEVDAIPGGLVDGLVVPDGVQVASAKVNGEVRYRETVALEFELELPPDAIDSPAREALDDTTPATVFVYVTDDGGDPTVREIQVLSNRPTPRVWVQRFDHGDVPDITIPDAG